MTELIDTTEMFITCEKFKALRERMKIANLKYRNTDNGKAKLRAIHKAFVESKKNDLEYKKILNTKQRERYHKRKEKKRNISLSLGIIENVEKMEQT